MEELKKRKQRNPTMDHFDEPRNQMRDGLVEHPFLLLSSAFFFAEKMRISSDTVNGSWDVLRGSWDGLGGSREL